VLSFIVSNNLSLRIIESYSYRQLIQFLSPSVLSLSSRTLHRELQHQFSYHRGILQLELHSHIIHGGRISITTDAWSARNYTEYAAVISTPTLATTGSRSIPEEIIQGFTNVLLSRRQETGEGSD
jgi:hypothetical protein